MAKTGKDNFFFSGCRGSNRVNKGSQMVPHAVEGGQVRVFMFAGAVVP